MYKSYRTDLTDEQWELLRQLIPEAKSGGRPRTVDMRGVVNAILYILVAGCAWSLLPHDFPTARFCKPRKPRHISRSKWKTVYHYFRQWRIDGDWERIHEQLRQWVRGIEDRHPSPTAAILDSQSVETATMIHPEVGNGCRQKNQREKTSPAG